MAAPSKAMRPTVGRRKPVMQLNTVVFPAPLGPMMLRISPGRTANDTSDTATNPPKRIVSCSTPRRAPVATVEAPGAAVMTPDAVLLGRGGGVGPPPRRDARCPGDHGPPFDLADPPRPPPLRTQERQH